MHITGRIMLLGSFAAAGAGLALWVGTSMVGPLRPARAKTETRATKTVATPPRASSLRLTPAPAPTDDSRPTRKASYDAPSEVPGAPIVPSEAKGLMGVRRASEIRCSARDGGGAATCKCSGASGLDKPVVTLDGEQCEPVPQTTTEPPAPGLAVPPWLYGHEAIPASGGEVSGRLEFWRTGRTGRQATVSAPAGKASVLSPLDGAEMAGWLIDELEKPTPDSSAPLPAPEPGVSERGLPKIQPSVLR